MRQFLAPAKRWLPTQIVIVKVTSIGSNKCNITQTKRTTPFVTLRLLCIGYKKCNIQYSVLGPSLPHVYIGHQKPRYLFQSPFIWKRFLGGLEPNLLHTCKKVTKLFSKMRALFFTGGGGRVSNWKDIIWQPWAAGALNRETLAQYCPFSTSLEEKWKWSTN